MINKDRIVPVMKTDLLSLYATMLALAGQSFTILEGDGSGNFTFDGEGGGGERGMKVKASSDAVFLANEPVKSVDLSTASGDFTLFFVAAYDYEGFGEGEGDGDEPAPMPFRGVLSPVEADCSTLYVATMNSGDFSVMPVANGLSSDGGDEVPVG